MSTNHSRLQDTVPKKRLTLVLRLPSASTDYVKSLPIFAYFIRLGDFLVQNAHFRPEVSRKLRTARDNEINRIKKADDEEKAEERKLQADKDKKEKRDTLLRGMSADQQKKYLDKEREKQQRKAQKKSTVRG
jgi:Skp family chaperone for outer membrane proteins